MRRRLSLVLPFVAAAVLTAACGKLLSPPPRPRTDGYEGIVTVRAGGTELARFSVAVRGEAVRRSTSEAEDAPYFIRETTGGEVLEVNPSTKSYRAGTPAALLAHLDAFPLGPDFNHAAGAALRSSKTSITGAPPGKVPPQAAFTHADKPYDAAARRGEDAHKGSHDEAR